MNAWLRIRVDRREIKSRNLRTCIHIGTNAHGRLQGGDGFPALQIGLEGPRGDWPVATGGHLFLLHEGCQLWYMDVANIMRLLMSGVGGVTHSGDGSHFSNPLQLTNKPSTNGTVWRLTFRRIFCVAKATVARYATSALRD